jgi:EpsI family protein
MRPAGTMTSPVSSRRDFLVGGTLIATAAVSGIISVARPAPQGEAVNLDGEVPQAIGPWRFAPGATLLIPKGEGAGDPVYDQLLSRHYISDADLPIMLLIAYGEAQTGSTQLHRPEVCYPSAGIRIHERPNVELSLPAAPLVPARGLTGLAPGRQEQIIYWSRVGREYPTTSSGQRWSTLRQTLADGVPDGVLVRISTLHPDYDVALRVLRRFAASLLGGATPALRRLLVGSA